MKKLATAKSLVFFALLLSLVTVIPGCHDSKSKDNKELAENEEKEKGEGEENEEYDSPDEAAKYWYNRTKNPNTGVVPKGAYYAALQQTLLSKQNSPLNISSFGTWLERGPNSDVAGPSGNSRPNGDVTAGRTRAIMVDAADATGNTVFLGSVDGGLWKTTNVTNTTPTWTLVNDFFSNMAISYICQDPSNNDIMYFCTGESYFSADAAAGDGIFKSVDHGLTFTQLSATTGSSYDYCSRVLCDPSGNLYVSTRSGVFRSTNGGTSFTTITPSGLASSRYSDMELSNTGRLHVSCGQFSTCAYRYTDNPSTVTSATWTSPASGYPASSIRVELGCFGNTLYALPVNASYQVPTIYKSTDGGANWATIASVGLSSTWASQQGWYSLTCGIDPSNINTAIIGGLDNWKTTDGGATWTQISTWVGFTGQYVHADNHVTLWYDNGNKLIFGSDGGIFYSSDKGTTIRDRNRGLRIKQFYSCAMTPSTGIDTFLAGAQDNGSHRLIGAGMQSSVEVTGGDGAFVHIDQDQPQFMWTSYVYNQYRRSSNGGASWTNANFSSSAGQFINPTDYDDIANIMYCANTAGTYRRWTNPQSGATSNTITIPELSTGSVTALKVSPFTSNRVYLGTDGVGGTKLVYVDNANTISSGSSGTNITSNLPTNTYTSCVNVGTNEQNLIVCYSNYGVQQVWVTSDGGTTWTNIDGNLPDMPVYWCMFLPGDDSKVIIATETGVWLSLLVNGASTSWVASPTFPTVRATMLQHRPSDNTLLASTYGRGLWTQHIWSVIPVNNFTLRGKWLNSSSVELNWDYPANTAGAATLDIESSPDGISYTKIGSMPQQNNGTYKFTYAPPAGAQNLFYRIKSNEITGAVKYSNTIKLFKNGGGGKLEIIKLYPNPVQTDLGVTFNITNKGSGVFTITSTGGQVLWRKEEDLQFTGNYARNWNIGNLPVGSYVFTLTCAGQKVSQSFIKR